MKFSLDSVENYFDDKNPNLRILKIYQIAKNIKIHDSGEQSGFYTRNLEFLIDKSDAAVVIRESLLGNTVIDVNFVELDTPAGKELYIELSINGTTLDSAVEYEINLKDRWFCRDDVKISDLVFTEDV